RITLEQHLELIDLLNRRRLAGYECYTPDPNYTALDLIVRVCAQHDAFRNNVEAAVLGRLNPGRQPDHTRGFFDPDNFSFGTPLERSALEAAIQRTPGIAGVIAITYRDRHRQRGYLDLPDVLTVGRDRIVRVDNDPNAPEHGSLRVIVEGGK